MKGKKFSREEREREKWNNSRPETVDEGKRDELGTLLGGENTRTWEMQYTAVNIAEQNFGTRKENLIVGNQFVQNILSSATVAVVGQFCLSSATMDLAVESSANAQLEDFGHPGVAFSPAPTQPISQPHQPTLSHTHPTPPEPNPLFFPNLAHLPAFSQDFTVGPSSTSATTTTAPPPTAATTSMSPAGGPNSDADT
ncbi:peptidyl-prolyl cis-trans isomerases [Striga asiatica]|uniref:Peptidyl-prolyl cis-trans isomerases n=1 Tax=Striga asiatica TaxID=4170 RepID=A0A5A7PM83_STRAF|nr:peptidyl-prolyl cis-trans isomerases [Striga asiatica]